MNINILMSANDRVYTGIELAIYSTLTHNKGINWYIFTMDIEISTNGILYKSNGLNEWERNKLKKIVQYLDHTSNIIFIDTLELYNKYLKGNINESSGFTPYANLRLLADIALPHVNHILYLDCDIAVQGDIISMYWNYINSGKYEYYAYACPDACDFQGEMVSGVMLMDLQKICRSKMLERARHNLYNYVYNYPDQCAIRDTDVEFGVLPETYSYMYELEKCSYEPIILHFTNKLSPKIYMQSRTIFYRRFPQFKYVKDGVELLDYIYKEE